MVSGEVSLDMCTGMVPATGAEALAMLESAAGLQESALAFLAAQDTAALPGPAAADQLRALERHDAIEAAVRGRLLEVFDARDAHLADGQRTTRTWLVHTTRVTRAQAAEYQALQALARDHQVLLGALAEGWVLTKSEALQLARWTRAIPDEYRGKAEDILVGAARAGVDLRGLAAICAEIRAQTAEPDPDNDQDPRLDRGVSLDTTFEGAGVLHGDMTPDCTAMVQAVLDALSAPAGGGDLRTRPQRYHDALAEAMKRLLASDLLPRRAGPAGQSAGPHLLRRAPRAGPGRDPAGQVDRRVPGPVGRPPGRHLGQHRRRRRLARRRRGPAGGLRRDDHPGRHRRHRPGRRR